MPKLPNIVVVMIDDLGWNQIGYHANPENNEIYTPSIDMYADEGIKIDRAYMTPCKYMQWDLPSSTALPILNRILTFDLILFFSEQGVRRLELHSKQVHWLRTMRRPFKEHGPLALILGSWAASHRS